MKQGRASVSGQGSQKVEPRSKAVSVSKVADMGLQVVRTQPYDNPGRGYKAPMASGSVHKSGSQGRH